MATAIVLVALAFRVTLLNALGGRLAYVTFYPAVAVAAIVGGFSAGALATILSAVLAHSVLAPLAQAADWLGLSTFLLNGTLISAIAEGLHIAEERLAAAKRDRENEQRLRLFIEQAPIAMAMLDDEMRYLAVSDRWMLDYGLDQSVIGRSHYDVFPEIGETWKDVHRRALAGEVVRAEEDPFTRRDGSVQWLRWEVRPWYGAPDEVGGIIISSEDVTGRHRAEEALRTFSRIIEQTASTVVVTDPKGVVEYVNPRFSESTGYTAQEAIGRRPSLLKSGHTTPEEYRRLWEIITQGGVWQGEFHNRRKDGSLYWERAIISPIRNASGEITHFAAIKDDISEQKRGEEALQRSEARLQLAYDAAAIAAWDLDLVTGTSVWTPKLYDLLGLDRGHPVSATLFFEHVHPDDLAHVRGKFADSVACRATFNEEFRIRRRDGAVRHLVGVGRVVEEAEGRPTRMIGVNYDITERRRAEEAVRASEKRLSAIIDTAVDAIVVIDERGIIQSVNPAVQKMFGHTPGELRGRNVNMLMPEILARAHDGYIEAYKRTGVAKIIGKGREVEGRRKDGSIFPADLAKS